MQVTLQRNKKDPNMVEMCRCNNNLVAVFHIDNLPFDAYKAIDKGLEVKAKIKFEVTSEQQQ